jgi:hypothetical protein
MSFTINANFLANARPVAHLRDGSKVVYSQGKFDAWCIYHVGNSVADAIKDVDDFTLLQKYTDCSQRFILYKDFLYIFDKVTNVLNYDVVENMKGVAKKYPNSSEVEFILIFLYAGMVAEENKDKAILKKYIKRLGVHQVLIERMPAAIAANYSRGKNWRELKLECEVRGFYTYHTQTQLSA